MINNYVKKYAFGLMIMVSVIIHIYNVEPYLFACFNSFLCQSFTDFKIICRGYASSDYSLEILNILLNITH